MDENRMYRSAFTYGFGRWRHRNTPISAIVTAHMLTLSIHGWRESTPFRGGPVAPCGVIEAIRCHIQAWPAPLLPPPPHTNHPISESPTRSFRWQSIHSRRNLERGIILVPDFEYVCGSRPCSGFMRAQQDLPSTRQQAYSRPSSWYHVPAEAICIVEVVRC